MASFLVSTPGLASIDVEADNWLVALGKGLHAMGRELEIDRLACEVLPNGTVIARDSRTGVGYVVQQLDDHGIARSVGVPITPPLSEASLEAIAEATTPIGAARAAMRLAQARVPAEGGAVILRDGPLLRFVAVTGPHAEQLAGLRLRAGTGVVGHCMDQGVAILVADTTTDPRHCREVDALTGYHTRSLVAVPIEGDDEVMGVIELVNADRDVFGPGDVPVLREVAAALQRRLCRD